MHLLFLYSLKIYTSQNKELSNWDFYENSSRLYGQKKSFSKPRERLHTMIPPATATQLEMFVSVMIMFTQVARSRKMVIHFSAEATKTILDDFMLDIFNSLEA